MRTLISILILTALAAPALAQGPPPPIPPPLLEGQAVVLDGDTIVLLAQGPMAMTSGCACSASMPRKWIRQRAPTPGQPWTI